MDEEYNNNEENNNNEKKSGLDKIIESGKKFSGFVKSIKKNPKLWAAIGIVVLVIIAICVILGIINSIFDIFFSSLSSHSITQNANSNAGEINQTSSIIYIDEDSGAYKLQEDFSKKILEGLENQSVNAEAAGFVTEDLEDMLNKYIKAEVQTMFPKTEVLGNDVDGLITVQRASTDRNNNKFKI